VLIPYGDEIGKNNIPLHKLPPQLQKDSRNINRGKLTAEELNSARGTRIMHMLYKIIHKRQVLRDYLNVWPQRLTSPPGLFAAIYHSGVSKLLVFVNITYKPQSVKVNSTQYKDCKEVLNLHEATFGEDEITLGSYAGIWLQK
jgi:hypothetical protein